MLIISMTPFLHLKPGSTTAALPDPQLGLVCTNLRLYTEQNPINNGWLRLFWN